MKGDLEDMSNLSYLSDKRKTRQQLNKEYNEFKAKTAVNYSKNNVIDFSFFIFMLSFFASIIIWFINL